MKKLVLFSALGFLLVSVVSVAQAETVSFQYKMIRDASTIFEDQFLRMALHFSSAGPGRPAEVTGTPAGATEPLKWYTCRLGDRQMPVAIDSADQPNLFIGRDGGNDFSGAKPVRRVKTVARWFQGASWQYGPVSLKAADAPEGSAAQVLFVAGGDMLIACPAGYLTGQLKIGGKSYKIAVIDTSFDGKFGIPATPEAHGGSFGRGDLMAIDLNGSGQFEYLMNGEFEIRPLTRMLQLEGKYYNVNVVGDGSSMELTEAKPKMGTLAVKNADAELMVSGDAGPQYLKGPKSAWQLPEGPYSCQQIRRAMADKQGGKWMLEASGNTGKFQTFRIQPDETFAMDLAGPLTVKTDMQKQSSGWVFGGKTVSIGFVIRGAGGEEYSPGIQKNGNQVPAPKIKILDEQGEVLATGDFAYG